MRNLRLPEGITSLTVDEQQFSADEHGTLRDLEDHVAREIMFHDPRITEFTPGGPDDPGGMPGAGDKRVRFLARVALLDRTELFAAGRSLKVSMPANMKTDLLREIVVRAVADANEDDLPLILGSNSMEDGTPSPLTAVELASANRGNDSLGRHGQHLSAGARGATFSQASLATNPAAIAAAPPAPPGLGLVGPTGTQQPPLNQLQTETGVPAHDNRMAPYPISVPPVDPLTGLPYPAGHPDIPETARPPLREPAGEASLTGTQVADVDARAHRTATLIEEAARKLDPSADGQGGPLLTPEQQAERAGSAKAGSDILAADRSKDAQIKSATEANHGNDGEGDKPKNPVKN